MKTIILRFRDLTTDTGETIRSHNEIISSAGYVWWGWWSKFGEKIPLETFRGLLQRMPLEVYLFDSGTLKLYSATIEGIEYRADGDKITSPDNTKTPEYYRTANYLAWYKISRIEEVEEPDEIISGLSYVEIGEFFETGESHFEIFRGKVIASLDELKRQDRTVWPVRDRQREDPSHEIHLYSKTQTQALDFVTEYDVKDRRDILWLSDLHFGDSTFPETSNAHSKSLADALDHACRVLGKTPAGVVISGDLTNRAEPDEYRKVSDTIDALSSHFRLSKYDFLVSPGNHDFQFEGGLENYEDGLAIEPVSRDRAGGFIQFYRCLYNKEPNEYFCSGRRLILANKYPVEIVSLNSFSMQQVRGQFQGLGYVGVQQMECVQKAYEWSEQRGSEKPFRIAVMHGHIVPVTHTEQLKANARYSLTLDSESVLRWCVSNKVDLILHGHMHHPHYVKLTRPNILTDTVHRDLVDSCKETAMGNVRICGMGTTSSPDLGELSQNVFGILSFDKNTLFLKMYHFSPNITFRTSNLVAEIEIPLGN